jgi:hypothetical protein
MKFRWNRTMLNLCGIVAAILKMVTGRNFSMSGINSGHHSLPTYEMSLKIEQCRICALWCPKLIPDIEKFLPVAIFKMAATIPHKFDIVRFQQHKFEFLLPIFYAVFWQPFWKWQTSWKFWKRRIAPQMMSYHCVKMYVSINNHLEVIQIQHCSISTTFHK